MDERIMRIPMIGCCPNITNEEYHADKSYLSRSSLMDFAVSPYTYWAKHLNPARPKKEPTPQMILGSAFHTLMLESHLFKNFYIKEPPIVYKKYSGKVKYDEYLKELKDIEETGKIILTEKEWENLMEMHYRVCANEQAMELIEGARIENSFFWQDTHSELLLKARPDVLHDNMIVDLKTCANASPRAFQYAIAEGFYHVQGAMIRDAVEAIEGRRINTVINICVETKYPHNMAIYIIDEEAIDAGEEKYKRLLLELKEAQETNSFCDYGIQTISLPRWAL